VVISRSGDKTVVVRVERREPHPFYGKVLKHFAKFHVHDEGNTAKVGDRVRIVESRPMSRLKRWRLVEVLSA
jgi:small subunit ribosomal protein S17